MRPNQERVTNHVISRDGTTIAYERRGSGPAVILVDGALCSRAFGPSPKLAPLLAEGTDGAARFTVYSYDRRGRGQSADRQPYDPDREIEDLAALIDRAGGQASLLGLSSGGALALAAAAAGLPVQKVVAYEPPYVNEGRSVDGAAHAANLQRLVDSDDRAGAVSYFMRDMVGAPAFVPIMMRLIPWIWRKLKAVAHTLPYDAAIMTEFRIPRERFASITRPVLLLNGTRTDQRLKAAARAVAATIPGAGYAELAGQTHNVSPAALAAEVPGFLADEPSPAPRWSGAGAGPAGHKPTGAQAG